MPPGLRTSDGRASDNAAPVAIAATRSMSRRLRRSSSPAGAGAGASTAIAHASSACGSAERPRSVGVVIEVDPATGGAAVSRRPASAFVRSLPLRLCARAARRALSSACLPSSTSSVPWPTRHVRRQVLGVSDAHGGKMAGGLRARGSNAPSSCSVMTARRADHHNHLHRRRFSKEQDGRAPSMRLPCRPHLTADPAALRRSAAANVATTRAALSGDPGRNDIVVLAERRRGVDRRWDGAGPGRRTVGGGGGDRRWPSGECARPVVELSNA